MTMPRLRFLLCAFLLFSACGTQDLLNKEEADTLDSVTIAYAEPLSSFSPFSYEAANRKYLSNVYEPLLRYDSRFNFETGLAVSWGRLNDKTWDFHLRKGVVFHDGTTFEADDVLYSLQQAYDQEESEIGALLSTLSTVEKIDDHRVEIHTTLPDPLLLNKLTFVNIVPEGYTDFNIPVGTGPYRITQQEEEALILQRFDSYWGSPPFFEEARLIHLADPNTRLEALMKGEVHVLANVPPQYVSNLEAEEIRVEDYPSLEVSYLMLSQKGILSDPHLRAAIWNALGTDYAENLGGGYLQSISQFAASGIMGYSTEVAPRVRNLELAKNERKQVLGDLRLTLAVPEGLTSLGEAIQEDLTEVNIEVSVETLDAKSFEQAVHNGDLNFYFFGWKYDLADAADFFESVIHSKTDIYGAFNGFHYANSELDLSIEALASITASSERRLALENIADLLQYDQVVIPLFESHVLYGVRPEVWFEPRLDGQIWASEIIGNMVE